MDGRKGAKGGKREKGEVRKGERRRRRRRGRRIKLERGTYLNYIQTCLASRYGNTRKRAGLEVNFSLPLSSFSVLPSHTWVMCPPYIYILPSFTTEV